ncbi:acid-sensing ion channel 1C-like [Ylistrum balloti]|uniref:acid-sensing ion channel 1C-like n=1 Tax=Ylistrum balloti TaxID=509963 RepID=UPI0029059143|nr:acid-sensing ion channel 1C-like [Ylistrum balloti]
MGGLLIYTCVDLFDKYVQHTTMANIKVELVNELPFPAITFCNLSPYKKSSLNPDAVMDHFLLTVSRMKDFVPPIDYDHPGYSSLSHPLPDGWLLNVSFSVADLYYACVNTTNQRMNCEDVLTPTITDIGLCYTYNSQNVGGNDPLVTSLTGSAKSLAFYINVNQNEYVYSDNLAAGMKIIVHDPREIPDTNSGFFASPGFSVYASLTLTKYKYLPFPYPSARGRYCLDTEAPGFQNPLNYHDMYSIYACIQECKYHYLVKLCGCQAPTDTGPERTCTFREYAECYRNTSRGDYLHSIAFQETCMCDSPCEFNVYGASASTAYFPSNLNEIFLNNAGFENLRTDYMEVRFFFDTLSYLNVEYIPEYSIETIIATLGGQMGIFLGASLLTLSELVEFLMMAALLACKRAFQRRRK